jgi:hypothetical protein
MPPDPVPVVPIPWSVLTAGVLPLPSELCRDAGWWTGGATIVRATSTPRPALAPRLCWDVGSDRALELRERALTFVELWNRNYQREAVRRVQLVIVQSY